ncbi:MAG TPA: hypothetical protein VJZ78_00665 [Anaerolineales bacterium]|nr:hypothetical protein [Anaerolineales bacterium]
MTDPERIKYANLLVSRLERISQDSIWAHRCSGIRGSLLNLINSPVNDFSSTDRILLDELLLNGSQLLEQACMEMIS